MSAQNISKAAIKYIPIFFLMVSKPAVGKMKHVLLSIPVVTLGKDAALRVEYNLLRRGTLGLEWREWGAKKRREEFSKHELEQRPGESLTSRGREIGLLWSRYSNPALMSGFAWSLGAGYRFWEGRWKHVLADGDSEPIDQDILSSGPTFTGRIGYRYVADTLGCALAGYSSIKHFQNQVVSESEEISLPNEDARSLGRRMMTSLRIGVELGWAF